MQILIGNAWPYANGPLHIGHLAALLPGDVLARYHRARGDQVCFVSGSDCYGTPIALGARREGVHPQAFAERYHADFVRVFDWLGFSYDLYGKTSDTFHRSFVQAFHRTLYSSPYIYEQENTQLYCEACRSFLTERYVTGACPHCGASARGDQCDACQAVLEPELLREPRCALCGGDAALRPTRHLYLALTKLLPALRTYAQAHPAWRTEARRLTARYLDEGLRDRAISRDLDWGIDVPCAGYEDKKIYIWMENVLGYLSASHAVLEGIPGAWDALWFGPDARHYYVHGKDNVPFHSIILPALLLAHGGGFRLPDTLVASGHLTLDGRRISTSAGYAVWARDLIGLCDPDSLRYFFLANGPERRDADFSAHEYVKRHNGELLGAWGNLVNRTLAFIEKYANAALPSGVLDSAWSARLDSLYTDTGAAIEQGRFRDALDGLFETVREANRYFDRREPWRTRGSDPGSCAETLYVCVQLIANLARLLAPFLPASSKRVLDALGEDTGWSPVRIPAGQPVSAPGLLFTRLEEDCLSGVLPAPR